ncbi:hypothetical protein [Wolbachia endosymbiont of Pentidionis agamae]|uniref:hypothetical protein n=1 Tax=Wolbachia endosymbiont of Pentidionis agamae TaxID=3110435 RepID=UPI002FD38423
MKKKLHNTLSISTILGAAQHTDSSRISNVDNHSYSKEEIKSTDNDIIRLSYTDNRSDTTKIVYALVAISCFTASLLYCLFTKDILNSTLSLAIVGALCTIGTGLAIAAIITSPSYEVKYPKVESYGQNSNKNTVSV